MFPETIFKYIQSSEADYQTRSVTIGENWLWNMQKHVQMIFHLKNGVFFTGDNDFSRIFKSVMEPIIELANWTEDLEVKDVEFFIEGKEDRALSFLVKKYHDEVYTREHNLDELFDEVTEDDNTYGGVLVDTLNRKKRPKAIPFTKIAFCDQTDVLGGPIGLKMYFSPSKLRKMEAQGWGKEENGASGSIEDLISLADFKKDGEGMKEGNQENDTPGKNIEVYIVRGDLPQDYLDDSGDQTIQKQLQVVAFYTNQKTRKKEGFCLYRKRETKETLKFFTANPVPGRGLGRMVGEKMLHPQVFSNFLEIHKMNMLKAGAKSPLVTDDETFTDKNKVQDMEDNEIMTVQEGRTVKRISTAAIENIQIYQQSADALLEQAQFSGEAFDPIMGKEPKSGTTFRGQERTVAQGRGAHDRRRGKRAKFLEQLYREDIIPEIVRELANGKEFMAKLDLSELEWVADKLAIKEANSRIKKALIQEGKITTEEEKEFIKNTVKENYLKGGSQKLLKILKGELKDIELRIGINIAGKQKDLAGLSDKILAIFEFIFANPQGFQQAMKLPGMEDNFNKILEFSGVSQTAFSSLLNETKQSLPNPPQSPQPQQNLDIQPQAV